MLWCLWCLVAAAPIDVPSGIRRVLSSANAAAALGLDDQVQGDRHRIRAAYREAMLAVHPDKHIANPSRSVRVAALEAAVTLSEARAEPVGARRSIVLRHRFWRAPFWHRCNRGNITHRRSKHTVCRNCLLG